MFPGSQEGERCHLQPKTFPGSRGDHTIKVWVGTSLGVQGLRLQAPSAGGPDWIPGQGTTQLGGCEQSHVAGQACQAG